jgi:hypothetical protein
MMNLTDPLIMRKAVLHDEITVKCTGTCGVVCCRKLD